MSVRIPMEDTKTTVPILMAVITACAKMDMALMMMSATALVSYQTTAKLTLYYINAVTVAASLQQVN